MNVGLEFFQHFLKEWRFLSQQSSASPLAQCGKVMHRSVAMFHDYPKVNKSLGKNFHFFFFSFLGFAWELNSERSLSDFRTPP
jgi:hypothetical protein